MSKGQPGLRATVWGQLFSNVIALWDHLADFKDPDALCTADQLNKKISRTGIGDFQVPRNIPMAAKCANLDLLGQFFLNFNVHAFIMIKKKCNSQSARCQMSSVHVPWISKDEFRGTMEVKSRQGLLRESSRETRRVLKVGGHGAPSSGKICWAKSQHGSNYHQPIGLQL